MLRPRHSLFRSLVALGAWSAASLGAGTAEARISKGPWVQRVTSTTAVVRVEVDPPAAISVEIASRKSTPIQDKDVRALHAVALTGLEPSTRYAFTVRAGDETGAGAFTSAPPDGASDFKFLVYGDNRSDDSAHAAIVRAMAAVPADFLVHTGDFVEDGGSRSEWQTFFEIEAPLLRDRCLFACVGNHELVDGSGYAFARYFGPSEASIGAAPSAITPDQLAGTFRWGNARFFLLNGMVPYRAGPDRTWLERVLSEADKEPGLVWRVVVVHHGPWSSGPHGENLYLHDANIPQILKAHHVDLVISGHDHLYERGLAEGMPYLVSGGGGAPTYRVRSPKPYARKLESVRHFIEATASQTAISFKTIRIDGTALERCDLRKEIGWRCDGEKVATGPEANPVPSLPEPSTPATSTPPASSRCACRTAGVGESAGGGLAATAALGLLLLLRVRPRKREHPAAPVR